MGVGYTVVSARAPEEDGEVGLEAKHCRVVFVEGVDSGSFSAEEMFPINGDLVADEENVGIMKCSHITSRRLDVRGIATFNVAIFAYL